MTLKVIEGHILINNFVSLYFLLRIESFQYKKKSECDQLVSNDS